MLRLGGKHLLMEFSPFPTAALWVFKTSAFASFTTFILRLSIFSFFLNVFFEFSQIYFVFLGMLNNTEPPHYPWLVAVDPRGVPPLHPLLCLPSFQFYHYHYFIIYLIFYCLFILIFTRFRAFSSVVAASTVSTAFASVGTTLFPLFLVSISLPFLRIFDITSLFNFHNQFIV